MLHIIFIGIYFITRKLTFPLTLYSTLITTNLISFSISLLSVFLFLKFNWLIKQKLIPDAQHTDFTYLYISQCLVTTCHCAKIWLNYWLYSHIVISYPWLIYFATGSLYLLISLNLFSHLPPLSSGSHMSVLSVSMSLLLFCYICIF